MKLILLIFCLVAGGVCAQNKIELKSGAVFFGLVTKQTEDSVILITKDSVRITVPTSALGSISYDASDEVPANFFSVGAAFGYPALVQLVGSYDWERFGARVSAGYSGNAEGFQFTAYYKFAQMEHFFQEVSLVGGYSGNFYIGPAYAGHFYGGFIQIGLAMGDGDIFFPFQIGYLYEFR